MLLKAFQLCRAGEYDLSQESLTKPSTLRALSKLKTTHPVLFQKLTQDDTAPDPVTKQCQKKKAAEGPHTSNKSKAVADATEEVEESEPVFTDTGCFDDSCDIPIGAIVDYVVSEGKDISKGVVEGVNGKITRTAEAEDPDVEAPAVVAEGQEETKEMGRGKQVRKLTARMMSKDWEFTADLDIASAEVGSSQKKRKKSA
ncbi:hypothetical protein F5050DRAFT_1812732 [Lentinula boryana]|uniref:Uncharacterized protein n=1 Tax=Lentinula boryana TaxID=40481 RepID=A0ABQ8PY18_9AGAR|nr:hypothetical protein F5050DRAFT_1812732 [Lentinula boryana]